MTSFTRFISLQIWKNQKNYISPVSSMSLYGSNESFECCLASKIVLFAGFFLVRKATANQVSQIDKKKEKTLNNDLSWKRFLIEEDQTDLFVCVNCKNEKSRRKKNRIHRRRLPHSLFSCSRAVLLYWKRIDRVNVKEREREKERQNEWFVCQSDLLMRHLRIDIFKPTMFEIHVNIQKNSIFSKNTKYSDDEKVDSFSSYISLMSIDNVSHDTWRHEREENSCIDLSLFVSFLHQCNGGNSRWCRSLLVNMSTADVNDDWNKLTESLNFCQSSEIRVLSCQ